MKKIFCVVLMSCLCFGLIACRDKGDADFVNVELDDYPAITEKSKQVITEIKNSRKVTKLGTKLEYNFVRLDEKDVLVIYYRTPMGGQLSLDFQISTEKQIDVSLLVEKSDIEKSDDFKALVSSFAGIKEFDFKKDMSSEFLKIVDNMETKRIGDLTVSMKEKESNACFRVYYKD